MAHLAMHARVVRRFAWCATPLFKQAFFLGVHDEPRGRSRSLVLHGRSQRVAALARRSASLPHRVAYEHVHCWISATDIAVGSRTLSIKLWLVDGNGFPRDALGPDHGSLLRTSRWVAVCAVCAVCSGHQTGVGHPAASLSNAEHQISLIIHFLKGDCIFCTDVQILQYLASKADSCFYSSSLKLDFGGQNVLQK